MYGMYEREIGVSRNIFINLTNHPCGQWSDKQLETARALGAVVDMPFPMVDECGGERYISALADEYFAKIVECMDGRQVTVHLMGEMTFTVALLKRLQQHGITCVASTTKRIVKEIGPGHKSEVVFEFERFRKYE